MSSHFRNCPKHRKPLPCSHCALAAKSAQAPAIAVMDHPKSASAIRAQEWREEQKKKNPNFHNEEAERKQQERIDPVAWSNKHPDFPLSLWKLRQQDEHSSLLMKDAPHGKGELIPYGGSDEMEKLSGDHTADAVMSELPSRAQLTDEELQKKLANAKVGLQEKIDSIREHWKHDKEFCALLNSWSL